MFDSYRIVFRFLPHCVSIFTALCFDFHRIVICNAVLRQEKINRVAGYCPQSRFRDLFPTGPSWAKEYQNRLCQKAFKSLKSF
jgi:hypothetical protein